MEWFLSTFFFLFGLCVGSFLNCVIYRLYAGDSFLKGYSYCPHCKHKLNWKDLVPVLSFIVLKGKCRYCRQKISLQYPLVELATGSLFLLIFNFQNWSGWLPDQLLSFFNFSYLLLISCFLIIIFVYDLKYYIIPNKVIYPAIGLAFFYRLFEVLDFGHWDLFGIWDLGFGIWKPLFYSLFAGFLVGLFFFLIWLLSRGKWLGFGDVKLVFLMGLFLGSPNILVALFLAFFIGAIIGIGLILSGKKRLSSEVPFGPFLVMGTFIALFWGENLINRYLNLFL